MSKASLSHRSSRRAILDRIRSRSLPDVELPTVERERLVQYPDLAGQFTTLAESIGATVTPIDRLEQVAEHLCAVESFSQAKQIASLVPEAVESTMDVRQVDDPHALADLDWVVARGGFGVAENGAIWVDGATLPHRTMLFIPQHLALVICREEIVPHMHAAYASIGELEKGFGVFVAGPSKTADIEQSLVLGAHGCRTLTIFLLAKSG